MNISISNPTQAAAMRQAILESNVIIPQGSDVLRNEIYIMETQSSRRNRNRMGISASIEGLGKRRVKLMNEMNRRRGEKVRIEPI